MTLTNITAVVVHPHPSMGGDSSHPFVVEVAARLAALGAQVATPDLRDPDVTASAAALTNLAETTARTDIADTTARTHLAEPASRTDIAEPARAAGHARVVLVGYSWGSVVASHATPAGLAARVLVAPPASMPLGGHDAAVPTLALVPEHDQCGGPDATQAALAGQVLVAMEVVPGADHFLWGSIEAIAQRSVDWLTELFPA